MSDEKWGFDDIVVEDDLGVEMDNDTYQDQTNPAPPVFGNYRMRPVGPINPRRDSEGRPVLRGGFPILVIGQVEIVEGLGDGVTRKLGLFQDVSTKPFNRFGVVASELGDLTRAFGTRNWRGLDPSDPDSGLSVLREAVESGSLFAAQLDWYVYDSDFVDAAKEQLADAIGDKESREENEDQKKLYNAIYRAARIQGMGNFPYDAERERFIHLITLEDVTFKNPTTGANITIEVDRRTLEARPFIRRYFPAKDVEAGRVKFGALNVKPKQAVA